MIFRAHLITSFLLMSSQQQVPEQEQEKQKEQERPNPNISVTSYFYNQVEKAMEYFNEAIKQKNDEVAMYNLSSIYIFNESVENFHLVIELLIKSLKKGFTPSKELLFIALIKEFGSDLQNIKDEIIKYSGNQSEMHDIICEAINIQKLDQIENFNEYCGLYKKKDFLYNHNCQAIETSRVLNQNEKLLKSIQKNDLNEMFYEGFGINLI